MSKCCIVFREKAAGFQLAFIKGRKRLGVRGEETDIRHWLPLRKSVAWLLFLSFFFLLLLGRTQKRRFDDFYQLNDMKSGLEFGSGPGSCFFSWFRSLYPFGFGCFFQYVAVMVTVFFSGPSKRGVDELKDGMGLLGGG